MYIKQVLYGDHPYGIRPVTVADVESVSLDEIRAAYNLRIQPQDMTIFVVGGIGQAELQAALNKHLGNWKLRGEPTQTLDPNSVEVDSKSPQIIIFDTPGAPQSNIFAATVIDPPFQSGDDAFNLANKIYGGTFTSRINANIREEKGWSYGVRSSIGSSLGPRVWQISAQVQTDKTSESITELLKEFEAINTDRPVSAEELDKVRNELVRKLPGRLASSNGIMGYLTTNAFFGLPDDYIEHRKEAYEAITLEELPAELSKRVDTGELFWFIAGDLEKIESGLKALELGPIEVWDADGIRIR